MATSDNIFDQRGFNLRKPVHVQPAPKRTQFRVYLADGSKHDVLAENADDAAKHVEKRVPGVKVTKTKVIREQVPA
jgi:hypothetical protein